MEIQTSSLTSDKLSTMTTVHADELKLDESHNDSIRRHSEVKEEIKDLHISIEDVKFDVNGYYIDGKNFKMSDINTTALQDYLKHENDVVIIAVTINDAFILDCNQHFIDLVKNLDRNLIIQHSNFESKMFVYYKTFDNDVITIDLTAKVEIVIDELFKTLLEKNFGLDVIVNGLKTRLVGQFNETNTSLLLVNFNYLKQLALLYLSIQCDILCFKYLLMMAKLSSNPHLGSQMFNALFNVNHPLTIENEMVMKLKNILNEQFAVEVEMGNIEMVEFLLKINCVDVNYRKDCKFMATIAYSKHYNDILLLLLKADAQFPPRFSIDNVSESVKVFVGSRNALHEMITSGSHQWHSCMETIDKSKLYLNSKNKSVLLTAIENKQFETYVHLKTKHLQFKDKIEESVIRELDNHDKEKLKETIAKLSPKLNDSSVLYLLSKSQKARCAMDNESKDIIENYYRQLMEYDTVDTMFLVVENCDYLSIMFDYESSNVCGINPTESGNVRGLTCPSEGKIYFGAKVEDEIKLLGTIAHELTHLAMNIVFENDCNPYKKTDTEQESQFNKIVADLNKKRLNGEQQLDEILTGAFDNYAERYWSRELVARVPQMLVIYDGDEKELIKQANELYEYYKAIVKPKCEEFIDESYYLKVRSTIVNLNNYSGIVSNIRELNVKFTCPVDIKAIINDKQLLILSTPSTLLSIVHLHQSLRLPQTDFLVFNYERFKNNIMDIKEAFKSPICNWLIIEISKKSDIDENIVDQICTFLKNNPNKQLIVIEDKSKKQCQKLFSNSGKLFFKRFCKSHLCIHTIDSYSLIDFDNQSKQILLNKLISFQGNESNLSELIDGSCLDLVDEETLTKLLENEIVAIGKNPPSADYDEEYYVARSFKIDELKLNETDLVNKMDEFPIILISEIAGMGKTTILTRMTRLINNFWIVRVDLNNFTAVLNDELNAPSFSSFDVDKALTFFIDKLLFSQIESRLETNFERNLMFYLLKEKSKVVVMFDGFDEISPNYKSIVIDLILALKETSVKQIWVTTRPHMKGECEENLPTKSLEMSPLTQLDQINFMYNYWSKTHKNELTSTKANEKLKTYAEMLIESLVNSIKDKFKFTGIPLQIKLLAVAYEKEALAFVTSDNQAPETIIINSLIELYEKFINEKFRIRQVEKKKVTEANILVQQDSKKLKKDFDYNHEIAAIYTLFYENEQKLLLSNEEVDDYNEFIVDIINGKENTGLISEAYKIMTFYRPQFVHRTFAEYFASRLIWRKMKDEKWGSIKMLMSSQSTYDYYAWDVFNSCIESLIGNMKFNEVDVLLKQARNAIESEVKIDEKGHMQSALCNIVKRNFKHFAWIILNSFNFFQNEFNSLHFNDRTIADLCKNDYDDIVNEFSDKLTTENSETDEFVKFIVNKNKPLHDAIFHVDLPLFKLIINHCFIIGIDVKKLIDENSERPLFVAAAEHDNMAIVKFLVEKYKCNVKVSCVDCSVVLIRHLLMDTNLNDYDGYSALHFAAFNKNIEMVDYLIDHCKCDVDGDDKCLLTPLQVVAKWGELEMAKHLVNNHSANPRKINKKGFNALHYAALNDNIEMLDYLIEKCQLNVDGDDGCYCSPLHVMAEYFRFKDIMYCINKYNANVNALTIDGKNALHVAAINGQLKVAKYFIENHDFNVNSVCNDGRTALHYAVIMIDDYHVEIDDEVNDELEWDNFYDILQLIDYLVEGLKGDVNAVDSFNRKALDYATKLKINNKYRYNMLADHLNKCQTHENTE